MAIQQQLKGWGMDVKALRGEGAFLSPPKVPRAFSTNVSNESSQPTNQYEEEEWCHYGGLPSPKAYM